MPIDAALIVCGLTNNAGNANATAVAAFEHEGMANVANFAHTTDEDAIEMCKAMNSRALNQHGHCIGALKVRCVRALACWARDLRNRQLPIDDNGFDAAALDSAMILLDTESRSFRWPSVHQESTLFPHQSHGRHQESCLCHSQLGNCIQHRHAQEVPLNVLHLC